MKRLYQVTHRGKEIMVLDYSSLNTDQMIRLVRQAGQRLKEKGVPMPIVSIFNNECYATPEFMRNAEEVTEQFESLIAKQAIIGLNATKQMILKGYNLRFNRNIPFFDTLNEALDFLADDNATDVGHPYHPSQRLRWLNA
ncbi:MAG: hypothetical protein AB7K37_09220 [Cyclobacteriaceae bacterium]